jgi:hypothetical protein
MTVAKLRALEGAEFPMSTAQRVSCGFAMLIILSALTGCSDADADIDEDFSIITGLSGGPTSYLDGIKEMHWVLKLLDQCGLDEQHIRGSATSAFMRTKLGFVSDEDVRDFFERPLFQLIVTALPESSGCAASISARVIAPTTRSPSKSTPT